MAVDKPNPNRLERAPQLAVDVSNAQKSKPDTGLKALKEKSDNLVRLTGELNSTIKPESKQKQWNWLCRYNFREEGRGWGKAVAQNTWNLFELSTVVIPVARVLHNFAIKLSKATESLSETKKPVDRERTLESLATGLLDLANSCNHLDETSIALVTADAGARLNTDLNQLSDEEINGLALKIADAFEQLTQAEFKGYAETVIKYLSEHGGIDREEAIKLLGLDYNEGVLDLLQLDLQVLEDAMSVVLAGQVQFNSNYKQEQDALRGEEGAVPEDLKVGENINDQDRGRLFHAGYNKAAGRALEARYVATEKESISTMSKDAKEQAAAAAEKGVTGAAAAKEQYELTQAGKAERLEAAKKAAGEGIEKTKRKLEQRNTEQDRRDAYNQEQLEAWEQLQASMQMGGLDPENRDELSNPDVEWDNLTVDQVVEMRLRLQLFFSILQARASGGVTDDAAIDDAALGDKEGDFFDAEAGFMGVDGKVIRSDTALEGLGTKEKKRKVAFYKVLDRVRAGTSTNKRFSAEMSLSERKTVMQELANHEGVRVLGDDKIMMVDLETEQLVVYDIARHFKDKCAAINAHLESYVAFREQAKAQGIEPENEDEEFFDAKDN